MHGDRIHSIVITVVYRSCAIPVAWHILHANRPGGWIAPIVSLLELLSSAVQQSNAGAGDVRPRPEESEAVGADMLSGMASICETVDQHRILSRCRHPSAGASAGTRAGTCIHRVRNCVQSTFQTPSWNDDRGLEICRDEPCIVLTNLQPDEAVSVLLSTTLLDRGGLQSNQERGVALAQDPQDGTSTGTLEIGWCCLSQRCGSLHMVRGLTTLVSWA